jgi:flagellar biosynthesis/type III secretory pathway M-ring protein FliF/YscJ
MSLLNRINTIFQSAQSRAILVGVLLLAILAVLQVSHLHRNAPMVSLLEDSELSGHDLERMQFALGKAGLSEFKVENGALMVPQRAHGAYLHAVAENDAIPDHLRDEDDALPAINPFMTRSQQRLITENEKKRQIRDMVTRLPFVEQAWFEMDTAEGGSAFEPARQSAVISIRPPAGTLLDAYQVATLRQMIGGAMAGIDPKDIVVIDVSAGYAHQDQASTPQFKSVSIEQRPVLEQKSHYTNRVREALKKYGPEYADIGIDVQVEMFEVAPTQKASFQPPVAAKPESRFSAVMGTNGVASIYDQVDQQRTDESVQPIRTVDYGSRVTVALAVPQSLVDGLPTTFAKQGTKLQTPVRQAKFQRLSQELLGCVRPVLPQSSFQRNAPFPVSINMVHEPVVAAATWQEHVQTFFAKHWPSLAVLAIGLVMLSIMTRSSTSDVMESEEAESPDIVSIASVTQEPNQAEQATTPQPEHLPDATLAQPEDYAKRDAERKLNRLFEKDPDSAAKVIESWIRDAA